MVVCPVHRSARSDRGANSTVAATALVTRDVPPDSIVLPPPSEIVRS